MFICEWAPAKLKCFFHRRLYSTNLDYFVGDSSRLHLTFVTFCLLSVIRKQKVKQCNYFVDQSALLTGFRTDFTSSVWNFCHWVADVPPRETSPAARSEEKRLFWQARRSHAYCRIARGNLVMMQSYTTMMKILTIFNHSVFVHSHYLGKLRRKIRVFLRRNVCWVDIHLTFLSRRKDKEKWIYNMPNNSAMRIVSRFNLSSYSFVAKPH